MKNRPKIEWPVAILLSSLLFPFCGCKSHVAKEFKQMWVLQDTLSKRFEAGINISINNEESISITVINSPWNDSSDDARRHATEAIAKVTGPIFQDQHKIKSGDVTFLMAIMPFLHLRGAGRY
jgi:hypothetical protein